MTNSSEALLAEYRKAHQTVKDYKDHIANVNEKATRERERFIEIHEANIKRDTQEAEDNLPDAETRLRILKVALDDHILNGTDAIQAKLTAVDPQPPTKLAWSAGTFAVLGSKIHMKNVIIEPRNGTTVGVTVRTDKGKLNWINSVLMWLLLQVNKTCQK